MKRIIILAMALLLVFSLTLTGCGGTDEPVDASDPAVEQEATITLEDLTAQYNEFATLFNELDPVFADSGIYDTNQELKDNMDKAYELLGMYAEVIQSGELTDQEIVDLSGEMQLNIESLQRAKEAHL